MEYEFMLPSASGLLGQVGEFPPAAPSASLRVRKAGL